MPKRLAVDSRDAGWYTYELSLSHRAGHTRCIALSGPIAQLAEQQTLNLRVEGSIPSRLTINHLRAVNNLRRGLGDTARRNRTAPALNHQPTSDRVRVCGGVPRCARLHVTWEVQMPIAYRSTSRDKVRAHRTRLRKSGLRPVQIWVPDVRSKSFAQAAHRQSLAVAKSTHANSDQAFVDAISAWNEE